MPHSWHYCLTGTLRFGLGVMIHASHSQPLCKPNANAMAVVWSWFPLGPAGVRTVLFFFSSLTFFILQLSTLKVGVRTSPSPIATLRRQLLDLSVFKTIFCYICSAWWFGEVLIWSSAEYAELSWVKKGDMSTPDRMNERPIYLRGVFLILALAQSVVHLYKDFSSLKIEASPLPPPSNPDQRTHRIPSISHQLQVALMPLLRRSLITSFATALVGPFIYTLAFRRILWRLHVTFAKLWFNIPRSDARPSGYPPASPAMILQSFAFGFLLVLTWEASAFLFCALMTQEPLKKGQPLSASSKDPNGTLLNGIKAKNDIVKTFAFWELALIARSFPERRKAIFADIERKDGTCWGQMQVAALDVIRAISLRINPPDPAVEKEIALRQAANSGSAKQVDPLPQIASPLGSKNIMKVAAPPQTQKEKLQSISGSMVKSLGQSTRPWSPPVAKVKDVMEHARPMGFSNERFAELLNEKWSTLQESPIGWVLSSIGRILRTSKQQYINAIVLGTGHASTALIIDSIESLTRMLVASLSDDVYGKAISSVPDTVRTFTNAITSIEDFVQKNGAGLDGNLEEVEIVVERLKAGLAELLSAFQLYLSDVGLGIAELREARHAAEERCLIPKETVPKQATRGVSAGEGLNITQEQATTEQGQRDETRPNNNTRSGSQGGSGGGGGVRPPQRKQAQSKSRRDWSGQDNTNGTAFVSREMEMVR
jgi:nucleoporin NDC1